MCLINFQLHDHPIYKLVLAANRDEFYERPTMPAHFWEDNPNILAGRDLRRMGTWLGVTKKGRIAALTNFREADQQNTNKISRGELVSAYLSGNMGPQNYLESIQKNANNYSGFNLIVGNPDHLFYLSNRQNKILEITAGTHGLSNHFLDTPWPKVVKGKEKLKEHIMEQETININKLFQFLTDMEETEDINLPNTGVNIELERKLSPLFIKIPNYGTRSSTILLVDKSNHLTFVERTYSKGKFQCDNQFTFQIEQR